MSLIAKVFSTHENFLLIGQKEYILVCLTNQNGCKSHVLVSSYFVMQYFQSLILIGITNDHIMV